MSLEPSDDEIIRELEENAAEPKKLIIFREHGIGGVLYNINSNVKFDEVITVDTTSESTAGQDASDYDEIQELATDGDYGSAAWLVSLGRINERIAVWKARQAELDYKRSLLEEE